MKVTKLPSGSWTANVYLGKDANGKEIRKRFTGKDKLEVQRRAAAFESEHRIKSSSDSFGTLATRFILAKKDVLSPSTIAGYTRILNGLKRENIDFYNTNIALIGSPEIQEVIDSLVRRGKSPKTARNYKGFICSVFTYNNLVTPIVKMPEKRPPRYYIPDEETIHRILEAAWNRPTKELWVCISLAICGPLREGEIAALAFTYDTAVNFEHNTIHVSHNYVRGLGYDYYLKTPKTASSDRVLTMPQKVMDVIREQGYVTHLTGTNIYKQFKRMLIHEGIEPFPFHNLRHYSASMLHEKGFPDAYIQSRTGHSTADVLRKVYTHTLADKQTAIDQAMLGEFDSLIS